MPCSFKIQQNTNATNELLLKNEIASSFAKKFKLQTSSSKS